MILDCKSVAAELWLPPAASLWRSEVDRRRNVRFSCTGAVVGPRSVSETSIPQQPTLLSGSGRALMGGVAARRKKRSIAARAKRWLPDPITGSFRLPDGADAGLGVGRASMADTVSRQSQASGVNLRNHPDEYAVR